MIEPDPEDFKEWLGHPVTEWVFAQMRHTAAEQQVKWSGMAWDGDLDPLLHAEAKVRADCYLALPDSTFEDWKAIYDSRN